jgi:hypothetical protein
MTLTVARFICRHVTARMLRYKWVHTLIHKAILVRLEAGDYDVRS